MDNKVYKVIICVLTITTIVFAVLFITKKCDLKCKCEDNCMKVSTTMAASSDIKKDNFIITEVNGCSIMANMVNDDKKVPYSISFCEMDGSADIKFNVDEEIWIKYDIILESYPPQIKPIEYGIVKK